MRVFKTKVIEKKEAFVVTVLDSFLTTTMSDLKMILEVNQHGKVSQFL